MKCRASHRIDVVAASHFIFDVHPFPDLIPATEMPLIFDYSRIAYVILVTSISFLQIECDPQWALVIELTSDAFAETTGSCKTL
jgi:hypothetical protein